MELILYLNCTFVFVYEIQCYDKGDSCTNCAGKSWFG